jgi:hypothetical protein
MYKSPSVWQEVPTLSGFSLHLSLLISLLLFFSEDTERRTMPNGVSGLTLLASRRISSPRMNGQYKVHPPVSSVMDFQQPPTHQRHYSTPISFQHFHDHFITMRKESGNDKKQEGHTSNCHSTRSTPVTISVTGCSTCNRVFLSLAH